MGTAAHRAWFTHLDLAYNLALAWRPKIAFQYDYASGTKDPASGRSGAFDPLFGVRRTDLGPTGIWSLALRSNLNSPSARLHLVPFKNSEVIIHHHWMYLAQARDQWRGVGLVDPTGRAGRHIGQQTEFRLRYRWSTYFDTDAAYVHFTEGKFVRTLRPGLPGAANYFYVSTDVHF